MKASTTANSAMAMMSSLVYAAIGPAPGNYYLLLSIMLISSRKPSAGKILLATTEAIGNKGRNGVEER